MKRILSLALALIFILSLTACSEDSESIVGKWYNKDGDYLEVLSDNTYTRYDETDKKVVFNGEWKYLETEEFFKFSEKNGDVDFTKSVVTEDDNGSYIEYGNHGAFYKDEYPVKLISKPETTSTEEELTLIECPNFVGKTIQEVMESEENRSNFNLIQNWDYTSDYEEGVIYRQSVAKGEKVKKTSEITLYISMGQKG